MEINVTGVQSLDDFSRAMRPAGDAATQALLLFSRVYTEALQRVIPVRSGQLRDSVRVTISGNEAMIELTAPYALYVVQGVRAQWMRWLVGHTVAFTAQDGSRVVRRVTRVGEWGGRRHWWTPGMPANSVFQKALADPHVSALLTTFAANGVPLQVALTGMPIGAH